MNQEERKRQFIIYSIRERLLLNEFLKNRNDFDILHITSVDGYAKYDAVIMSGGTEYIIETKCRTYPIEEYENWVIQKDKYDYLISQYHLNGLIPLYVTFTSSGALIWDLTQIKEPEWFIRDLPANSIEECNDIEKIIGYVKKKDSNQYLFLLKIHLTLDIAAQHYDKYFKNK